jgi:DNA-binding MarR family transcriptional regulator
MARQLLVGWRWFDDQLRQGLIDAGFGTITSAQSILFPYLDPGGSRQTELAERLDMTKQAVNQLVAGLVEHGFLELKSDAEDKRSKLIHLTARGKESVVVANACLRRAEADLADRIGAEKTAELRKVLALAWPE